MCARKRERVCRVCVCVGEREFDVCEREKEREREFDVCVRVCESERV